MDYGNFGDEGKPCERVLVATVTVVEKLSKVMTKKGSEAEIFDGEIFEVKEIVAVQSGVLKQMVEDGCTAGEIPIDNVDALTLAKIIKWCNKHHNDEGNGHVLSEEEEKEKEMELKKWESEFIDELNYDELYFILTGSNYMNVKELLGCTAQKVADMTK
ncbi:hypothetical protein LWI29_011061 [Acer saccharum]|uniref:SKP1 component POZ domain-containing protein n=1 Tax=Acer saccharum TaxID=4024 RepID=A0AA39W594_ACESA|nr:hypothetical protein LWI29_011061 [Acer saccharum]